MRQKDKLIPASGPPPHSGRVPVWGYVRIFVVLAVLTVVFATQLGVPYVRVSSLYRKVGNKQDRHEAVYVGLEGRFRTSCEAIGQNCPLIILRPLKKPLPEYAGDLTRILFPKDDAAGS